METFLQQYGLAILTVIIIAMLIIIATPVGGAIQTSLLSVINSFLSQAQQAIQDGAWAREKATNPIGVK